MTAFNHGAFVSELRKREGTIPTARYANIMAALEVGLRGEPALAAPVTSGEPGWLVEARKHIGMSEIPGPKHNPTILSWVKRLGGWFTDDETPWCGTFVAHCMMIAALPVPKNWFRALDWKAWGKDSLPRVGAVVVFGRQGGGHVGFLVGESANNFYVLGGNQSNQVNIMPLAKSRAVAIRWPASLPAGEIKLPRMSGGTVSRNEQ